MTDSSSAARSRPRSTDCRAAYLVTSHTQPTQVLRLVRTLRALSPSAFILVHHDQHRTRLSRASVRAAGGDHLLGADRAVSWGSMGMVDALVRSLEWIEDNVRYDWVVHLSGQDYPLRPLAEYESRLRAGTADAYLRLRRVGTQAEIQPRWRDEAVRRYFCQYRHLPAFLAPPFLLSKAVDASRRSRGRTPPPLQAADGPAPPPASAHARRRPWAVAKALPDGRVRVGMPARWTPFTGEFSCFQGSYWLTASGPAVRRLLALHRTCTSVYEYFRRTSNPDESYLATLLGNDGSMRIGWDEFRYVHWTKPTAHPDVVTTADLPRVLRSGRYLARKFDATVDPRVLTLLDRRLGVPAEADGEEPG